MSDAGYQQRDVKAWMEVDLPEAGTARLEILKFSSQFGLNSIPQATCSLALGVDVNDIKKVSVTHIILSQMRYKLKARVYGLVKPIATAKPLNIKFNDDSDIFNGQPFLLFDGYTSGAGYRRSGSSIEYVVSLEHWLSDLTASSALSPDLQPGVPFSLFFPSVKPSVESGISPGVSITLASTVYNFSAVQTDLWGLGIKKYLTDIAGRNALSTAQENTTGQGIIGGGAGANFATEKNSAALSALAKFLSQGPYHVPLRFKNNGNTSQIVCNILRNMAAKSMTNFDGTTFWDNIMIQGASVMYNVAPTVNWAIVAPKLPNYKKEFKTIYTAEINGFDISTSTPRFLKGVILKCGFASGHALGGMSPQNVPGASSTLSFYNSGIYVVKDTVGTMLVQNGPDWLDLPAEPATVRNERPVHSLTAGGSSPADRAIGVAIVGSRNTGDAVAHAIYANEILKYRSGSVSGKLRLDICPGSIVKVDTKSVRGSDINPEISKGYDYPLFGCVDQVSVYIDAVAAQASTSFVISNIRSEAENEDPNLSMTENPIYDTTWNGAPLYL